MSARGSQRLREAQSSSARRLLSTSPIGRLLPRRDARRVVQLDVLRGVAISLVVSYHAVFHRADAPLAGGRGSWALDALRSIGPTGVDLFFVLSGFLIGGLLFKELRSRSRLDVGRFIVRRGFKIWPSYFAFLAVILTWRLTLGHERPADARALLPNLLHVQNYLGSPWAPHTWSLAIEEHFYLALPLLLLLLARRRGRGRSLPALPIVSIALAVIVGCAALRCLAPAGVPGGDRPFPTHLRVDGLFLGVLLSYLYQFRRGALDFAARNSVALFCLGVALLIPFPLWLIESSRIASSLALSSLAVGYGCIVLAMVLIPSTSPPGRSGKLLGSGPARALAFLGYFSYPIYLWHIDAMRPVVAAMQTGAFAGLGVELRWLAGTFLCFASAVAAGVLFGLFLEKPTLALRDRLFPPRADALPARD